ncbi:MAG: tRNA (adenine(9)-N1)-methyltransferase Trm10 [Pyrobaculum sp.]
MKPVWIDFFRALRESGVESLCLPRHFKCWGDLPQCVAVWVLVGRYAVCRGASAGRRLGEWGGVTLLGGRGGEPCSHVLARGCGEVVEVPYAPPDRPRVVVDLSLWAEHTEGEKNELVEQILATLKAVRAVLWDGNLWLTNTPGEFLQLLSRHAPGLVHKMRIFAGTPSFEKPIVLDPEGDCLFIEEVARSHVEFIIGGIVDKERSAKGATARLAGRIGVEKRCRIELRGSRVGVPDRINKIAEIVLRTLSGSPLEAAVLAAQAKRDRVYRLMWELQRRIVKTPDGGLAVTRQALEEANWLGAPWEEVELAVKKLNLKIL